MRSSWVILVAGLLSACSSSPDFCDQFSTVFTAQENSISSCTADGGNGNAALDILSNEFPFSIRACSQQLPVCTASDVQALNATLKCVKALPAFQCDWLDQPDAGAPEDGGEDGGTPIDGGLAAYQAAVVACEAMNITPTCQGGVDGGMGCGTETHSAINALGQALPLNLGLPFTDCLGTSDSHYLSLTAPAATSPSSQSGGYFLVSFAPTDENVLGQLVVQILDNVGNPLSNANYQFNSNSQFFLSAAPNATFVLEVRGDSANIPLGYNVNATFTPINDPYKPDDARPPASSPPPQSVLTLGQATANSYCWAGQVNATALTPANGGQFDDWFAVSMPGAGTATIQLLNFPGDFAPEVDFTDGTGTPIPPETCKGCTSNKTNQFNTPLYYKAEVAAQGTYFVHVFPFVYNHQTYANYSIPPLQPLAVLPAHLTTPYSLTVSFSTP